MPLARRAVVVGLGIQGRKRVRVLGDRLAGVVDPTVPQATHRRLEDVAPETFDALFLCCPEEVKRSYVEWALAHGKHVLVEKPLLEDESWLVDAERRAREAGLCILTAYNHRFEPAIADLATAVSSGSLGELLEARFLYGNGTAEDVRRVDWKDSGSGVIGLVGSHLLDLCHWLWPERQEWEAAVVSHGENRAPVSSWLVERGARASLLVGSSLIDWKNVFTIDVIGTSGSAHVRGLQKWGGSEFILRHRVLPSGIPPEQATGRVGPDPTWEIEEADFWARCEGEEPWEGLGRDVAIARAIDRTKPSWLREA
jgi:scyllo-inositol 2-dehydrogenase (NADP+)